MSAVLFAIAGQMGLGLALRAEREISLHDDKVYVGDILTHKERLSSSIAGLVVTRLPRGTSRVALPRHTVAALLRRALPGIPVNEPTAGAMVFRAKPTSAIDVGCYRLGASVRVGEIITREMVTTGPCKGIVLDLRYDGKDGLLSARAAAPAGTNIGRTQPPLRFPVYRGDTLTLTSSVGAVKVERPVEALQAGRAGARVFVRDGEGHILSVAVGESGG